ncbi:hypothetical protein ACGFX4_19930 [Kitasatospora sp. NPDC048365]|uniref:hypothetical protein n=1 Tax=Kitasatospora sp. NPDC048365 TaxID=3364050 RepID=UPI0037143912
MAEDEQYGEGFEPDDLWQSRAFEQASKMAEKLGDIPTPRVVTMLATLNQEAERKQQLSIKRAELQHELEMAKLKDGERLHELKMAKLKDGERLHELEMAKLKDGERLHELEMAKLKDADRQHLVGVAAGVLVSLSCIGGAIWFGVAGHYWPMGLLVGPVLVVLIRMFLLRTSETGDTAAVGGFLSKALGRAPAPPVDPGPGGIGPVA